MDLVFLITLGSSFLFLLLLILVAVRAIKNAANSSDTNNYGDDHVPNEGRNPRIETTRLRHRAGRSGRRMINEDEDVGEEIEEFDDEFNEGDDSEFPIKGKIGVKKQRKLEMKAERRLARERELQEREERKRLQEERDRLQKLEEERLAAEEKAKEEAERLEKEKKEREEHELYLQLKQNFSIDEEGYDGDENDEDSQNKLQAFVEYIQNRKVVHMDELAGRFNLKTQEVIQRIQSLLEQETLVGVIDDRGKFIYITQEELNSVARFIRQRGRISLKLKNYSLFGTIGTICVEIVSIFLVWDPHGSLPTMDSEHGHEARKLTQEEIDKLKSDNELISEFHQKKLEKNSKKNWDLFYKRNQDRFFRNRTWTTREFQELIELDDKSKQSNSERCLLEVGCGVGNFIWPLMESGLSFRFYACDFSPVALDLLKKNELYDEKRCHVFLADLTEPNGIQKQLLKDNQNVRFDVVSLIFVLSSIHPEKMVIALKNIEEVLEDDGIIIFRDYGLYDHSMLRYSTGHKLAENFYVRQDGTRTYYFSTDSMRKLLMESELEIINLEYIQRETINIKESLCVPRIFLQGKFKKKNIKERRRIESL